VALYLLQVSYTPEAWAAQLKNPQDRAAGVVGQLLERLGGRFVGAYFAFGEYDIVAVMEVPNTASAAAVSMALSAGGALKAVKTTPLMTMEEGVEAMRKAGEVSGVYRPPTAPAGT